jgi:hypothetical protein
MVELREMAGPLDGVEKEYPTADKVNKKDAPSLGEPLPSMRQALMDLFATKMGTVFYILFWMLMIRLNNLLKCLRIWMIVTLRHYRKNQMLLKVCLITA